MKRLIILALLAGLFACSSMQTAFDYDRQTDFAKYKTYNFTKFDLVQSVGQLNSDRFFKAVEDQMALKGFTKSDNPDVLVDLFIKSEKKVDVTATTTGAYGAGVPIRYGYGGGFNTTTRVNYDEYTEGTLLISLVDNATQVIVWQGTGTKTVDEEASADKRDKMITYSVSQILKNYPPKKK